MSTVRGGGAVEGCKGGRVEQMREWEDRMGREWPAKRCPVKVLLS